MQGLYSKQSVTDLRKRNKENCGWLRELHFLLYNTAGNEDD